jgi:hypothetical protein
MPVLALNEQISCEARLISRPAKTETSTNVIPRNDVPGGFNNRNDGRIVVDIIRDFKVHGVLDERYEWILTHANTIRFSTYRKTALQRRNRGVFE